MPDEHTHARTRDGVALAVYRLGIRGLGPRETMLPVAIALSADENPDGLGDALMGALADAPGTLPPPSLDQAAIEAVERRAFERAELRRREIEELERVQFTDRIAVRKATLRRSYDARVESAVTRFLDARNDRIKRMYQGQFTNLAAERDERIAELDDAPEPSAEIELLSMAIFSPPR